jgi:hypothetical protein
MSRSEPQEADEGPRGTEGDRCAAKLRRLASRADNGPRVRARLDDAREESLLVDRLSRLELGGASKDRVTRARNPKR